MLRLFKHYVPYWVLLLGALDFLLLLGCGEAGWLVRIWQIGGEVDADAVRLPSLLIFAAAIQLAMVAVGVYRPEALLSLRIALARLLVALALGILFLSLVFFLVPPVGFWRSNLLYATMFAVVALTGARLLLSRAIGGDAFKRRVLVLGAGARAARVEALAGRDGAGFTVAGYVAMNDGPIAVGRAVNRADIANFADHLVRLGASEVVLALEERRNALPLADLLRAKTTGVDVNDLSTFLERETGRVDLDSLRPAEKPSEKISQDGLRLSRSTRPVSRSRKEEISLT